MAGNTNKVRRHCLLPQIAAARRILVVTKFRFFGDSIVATPFLRKLHESCPQAKIDLLAGPSVAPVLENLPYLSEIIPFGSAQTLNLKDNLIMRKRLHLRGYNCAFILNRSLHSGLLIRGAHIPCRIGYNTEHRGFLLDVKIPYEYNKSELDCCQDILRATGIEPAEGFPELVVTETEFRDAGSLLAAKGYIEGEKLIAIHPGVHEPYVRQWGVDKFAAAADQLVEKYGGKIVLMGSPDEKPDSDKVASAMKTQPILCAGSTTIRQALAILKHCDLWIGNDGGMMHAAAAVGTSTVGIFGPTKAKRWGYEHPDHRVLVNPLENGKATPDEIRKSIDNISVERVVSAASELLDQKK